MFDSPRSGVVTFALFLSLGLALVAIGGCEDNGGKTDKSAAAKPATTDPNLTAERIAASQERVGLSTAPDQLSHHLTAYHDKLGKPLAKGPNGGTLIKLPGELVVGEVILNRDAGRLTLNILNAELKPAPLAQANVKVDVYWSEGANPFSDDQFPDATVLLAAPATSGDPATSSATFAGTERDLARRPGEFVFKISQLKIGDQEYKALAFEFPEGVPVTAESVKKAADASK